MEENNDNINTKKQESLNVNKWFKNIGLGRVVRKVDNVFYRINHHPADSVLFCFFNTYPQDTDLSCG